MIALDFSHVNYFGNNDDACTASFCFKSLNAFAQARYSFGKTQRSKSLLLPITAMTPCMGNVRHPCRTRVSEVYFTQGPKAEGIFAESF